MLSENVDLFNAESAMMTEAAERRAKGCTTIHQFGSEEELTPSPCSFNVAEHGSMKQVLFLLPSNQNDQIFRTCHVPCVCTVPDDPILDASIYWLFHRLRFLDLRFLDGRWMWRRFDFHWVFLFNDWCRDADTSEKA